MTDATEIKILKKPALKSKCGFASDQHVHQLVRTGRFPAPINLGCRSVGWIEAEVDAWLRARIAERDAKATSQIAGAEPKSVAAEAQGIATTPPEVRAEPAMVAA